MFEFKIRYQAMAMLYKCLFRLFFLPGFCHKLNDFCLQKRPEPRLAPSYKTCLMNGDITGCVLGQPRCAVSRGYYPCCSHFLVPSPSHTRSSSETDGSHFPRSAPGTEEHRVLARRISRYGGGHLYPTLLGELKSLQWLVLYQYFETSVCKRWTMFLEIWKDNFTACLTKTCCV